MKTAMWKAVQELWVMPLEQYQVLRCALASVRLTRSELFFLSLRKIWYDFVITLENLYQFWKERSLPLQYTIMVAIFGFFVLFIYDKFQYRRFACLQVELPVLKRPNQVKRWDLASVLDEGVRRYPYSPYVINNFGFDFVVFPESSWDEVKRIPASKASLIECFKNILFQGWGLMGTDTDAYLKVIGTDLTRAVPSRILARQEGARHACQNILGPCPNWKSFRMFWAMNSIISTTDAFDLGGTELGTNRQWIFAVEATTYTIVLGISLLSRFPRLLRPLIGPIAFLPTFLLYWYMRMLLRFKIQRDIREYTAAVEAGVESQFLQPSSEKKLPIVGWLLSRYKKGEKAPRKAAHDLILISFASSSSTSATLYFIMAELATRPTLVDELREELSQIMVDGKLPQTQLDELQKLDSTMRECSRMNPFGDLTMYRQLLKPMKLSNAPELPAGSLICVDVHNVARSEVRWKNPATFDPMRFLKLRQQPGEERLHHFTSLGSHTPGWGDGPQACPGRAYAASTLKTTLAYLLLNYDFKLSPNGPRPKRNTMPHSTVSPDMTARILFRERKSSDSTT